MSPKSSKSEGDSLLKHDVVAKVCASEEPLSLSGAIDILWQIKDVNREHVVQIETDPFMVEFFEQVQQIKQDMATIRNNIQDMSTFQAKIISEVSQQKSKELTERLDRLMLDTSAVAKKVKEALKQLEVEKTDNPKKNSNTELQRKIHQNVQGAMTKQFVELMTRYQDKQAEHKQLLRGRVARQYKVANPGASKEEVDAFIDSGADNVFADKVFSKADQVALSAYQDVQSKHEELLRLESSIRELHQLFVDMAILVETQGEMLDNIEESVSTTVQYTEQGVEQLVKAKESAKSARKKMCILAACFAFGLMILLAWFSSFIPRF